MTDYTPTVFIVDDDIVFCDALKWLLGSINLSVEIYANGHDYLKHYDSTRHGCLLVDIRMPIMGGFELLQELNKLHNRIPIIFVTGHGTVPMAVRAMQEGAIDFITKPFNDEALLEKIQKAIITDRKRMNDANNYDYTQKLACLTPREIEVMKHIAEGKLNKQIASLLNISYSTVDFHRANLMNKLQIRSVAELIKIYLTSSYST